ncbi:hypothetical protein GSI_10956 [Ganoderma sinense ZZ0214-1]|uniref:F-box domain-containing protein n=1 Tax=Ganoderma sinense ZZ0214-1 TaxID=1077348 RepID=A0A2G8S220_9APHY|nr:hypothetical protein GSI_10956 [Ganoderma sinense ZZ0214-1]
MSAQPSIAHPGQSIHLLDLNQDIFQHIVSFLDRPVISILSKTCRSLHNGLAGQLLRGTVSVRRPLLVAFKDFLDADRSRYEFLKHWKFITVPHTATYSPSQVSQDVDVCSILHASHNLVSLSLDKVTPDHFQPKDLRAVFTAIPQLQELSLLSVGPKYGDVLHGVLPNLRILKLDFSTDRLSPLNFLATHRTTLRELTLEHIWPQATFPPDTHPDPFPSVRRLHLNPISSPSGLSTIARCFPNLDALTLHTVILDEGWRQEHGFYAAVLEHDQQGAFAPFARWYDRTAETVRAAGGTWARLATLRALDSVGLFFAPLCCTAERLEVVQASIMPEQMAHVYRELRPRVVVLPPESSPNAFLEAARCHLVTLEHAPSVSHLTVRVSSAVVPVLPLDQVLAALSQALPRSSVSHLLLELSSLGEFGQSEELKAFYRNASDVMQLLSSSIPSLRKIFFDIEGRDLKAWEMDTAGSGAWMEMNEWVALRVISEEGMRDSGRAD